MRGAYDVATVRAAEAALMSKVGAGVLMERAAMGLADTCSALLRDVGPGVAGSRVVILAGSGSNGGDALYAGVLLMHRGASVTAVLLDASVHEAGRRAFVAAGGLCVTSADTLGASDVIADADIVLDGIVGIGGRGPLRPLAVEMAECAADSGAIIVAVDLPSGVNADTGSVADARAVIHADVTVTFGCLKPGLLVSPARDHAGAVTLVDIGLDAVLPEATLLVLDHADIAQCVPEPTSEDYKYSRGIVGVVAGSSRYRGAAFLATGAARHGNAGMVHFLDRGDGLAADIVDRFWDVVTSTDAPASVSHMSAWAIGPGIGRDISARSALSEVLATSCCVVVDADALRLLGDVEGRPHLERASPTVLTPHLGEFSALGFAPGVGAEEDRVGAAREAAKQLGAVVVLKGPGTVTAAPSGLAFIDTEAGPELGTAGSGDVLSGLIAAMLAGAAARGAGLDDDDAALIAAAAVALHGIAGHLAAEGGRPITAPDVIDHLPAAMALVRRGPTP